MSIKILNYKSINEGHKKALFSVQIPEWGNVIVNFCTLFEKEGRQWIGFASRKENDQYVPIFELSKDLDTRLKAAIKDALKLPENGLGAHSVNPVQGDLFF